MKIGIFARTFHRPTLEGVLGAVRQHGLACVQFNLAGAGFESLPATLNDGMCAKIRDTFSRYEVKMAAVSGTFNAIHPDAKVRAEGSRRCRRLIRCCRALGTSVVSLCTGTRDLKDPWRFHADNSRPEAWRDLVQTLEQLLPQAEEQDVILGIEPETSNVVDSSVKARQLLDEMKSRHLKIVMDAANLFGAENIRQMAAVLDEAFELLGQDIVMAHAKDVACHGAVEHKAAGQGCLDYLRYLELLKQCGFTGPLLLHNLAEADVDGCVAFLKRYVEPEQQDRKVFSNANVRS
ncbi:MAG: sugar phosphate isomerase/epimerase [Verrucomicrobia bacterium]|nr:sugar phosphate isomerase/epimerase [Verrucomicrobiota bacterium]